MSSISVRNIRLIYGSLVRVTSSNAEVGICASPTQLASRGGTVRSR